MKNTVKLILIIFFSIIHTQDINLTGTTWEWGPHGGGHFLIFSFMDNNNFNMKMDSEKFWYDAYLGMGYKEKK